LPYLCRLKDFHEHSYAAILRRELEAIAEKVDENLLVPPPVSVDHGDQVEVLLMGHFSLQLDVLHVRRHFDYLEGLVYYLGKREVLICEFKG